MMKSRISQLLLMLLMMTAQTAWGTTFDVIPWEGTGAVDDPYIIEYPSQLILLAERVNSGTGDEYAATGYSGKYFQLGADIAFDPDIENNFTPIGKIVKTNSQTELYPFKGTFKGNGYKITGIHINDASLEYAGLFGVVSGATLDGITVSGAITAYKYIGGLVGSCEGDNVTISNCVSSTELVGRNHPTNSGKRGEYVGGLVGYIIGAATISGCRADGYASGNGNVGGFVGCIEGTGTVNITNCVARGDVRSTNINYGGFIGWANDENATIKDCWCSGAVWGKGGNIGAFVGNSKDDNNKPKSTFENCSVYPYASGPRYFSGSNMYMTGGVLTATDYATMTNGWPAVKKHSHGLIPITTAEEFLAIATNATSLDGCYVLVDDIDLHGQTIEPIGQTIITINDGKTTLTDTPFTR